MTGLSSFAGDPERACTRLRELAEEACQTLSTETLNALSFAIACYIDHEFDRPRCKAFIIEDELAIEQQEMKSHLEKQFK